MVVSDQAQFGRVAAQDNSGASRGILMADAVEAVALDPVLIPLVGDPVHAGARRQGGVEGRIEDHDLRHAGPQGPLGRLDGLQLERIVLGSETRALVDPLLHLRGHQGGFLKQAAAVHHAVAGHGDLAWSFNNRGRAAPQALDYGPQHVPSGFDIDAGFVGRGARTHAHERLAALAAPLGIRVPQQGRRDGGKAALAQLAQSRLQRARSAVQHQDFHTFQQAP